MKSTNEYIRTDLAAECVADQSPKAVEGYTFEEREVNGIPISVLRVDERGSKILGKVAGTYITVTTGKIWYAGDEEFVRASELIADLIKSLACEHNISVESVLAIGLGNRTMTADSLGPLTVDRLNVTRHIRQHNPDLFNSVAETELAAFTPGVVGQTGIETAELIRGVTEHVKPSLVVLIDALAARSSDRLASTVQLSDTGISPGSGVGNRRDMIDSALLGVPVITIGVPMVVDSSTLVYDALQKAEIDDISDSLREVLENGRGFFVSLRDSDTASAECSRLTASAINQAFGNLF